MSKAKILKNENKEDKDYKKLIEIGKEGLARNKKDIEELKEMLRKNPTPACSYPNNDGTIYPIIN